MKITFPGASDLSIDTLSTGFQQVQEQKNTVTNSTGMQKSFSVEKGNTLWGAEQKDKNSFSRLLRTAEYVDVNTRQDYMTVMSHTLSEEDYAKLSEEGFRFKQMEPEEAVTIVDKIKAELAKAGVNIVGYTDDCDVDTLAAALGSQTLAQEIYADFAEADLPITEDTIAEIGEAWNMASALKTPDDNVIYYMMEQGMQPRIQDLYLAQSSGVAMGGQGQPKYIAEAVRGYYSQSGAVDTFSNEKLAGQIEKLLDESDFLTTQEDREIASGLLEKGIALTKDHVEQWKEWKEITLPPGEQDFAAAITDSILEGKQPVQARLVHHETSVHEIQAHEVQPHENIYKKAKALLEQYRMVEEVRLHMTAEVNVKLLKSGFALDTASIEEVLEKVKQAEAEVASKYFPGEEEAVTKYQTWNKANDVMKALPEMPARILSLFTEKGALSATGVSSVYEAGIAAKEQYEQAQESYETLMTKPTASLGDSIRKAFANVDDILKDLSYEITEENRKAVRVLGYNQMDIKEENIDLVKQAQQCIDRVVEKMTPAAVLKMIRDNINPLEKSFEELNTYFEKQEPTYEDNAESYSRFLFGLERNKEITEAERESFIGIYRLLRQVEKTDGAAAGSLVNVGAELNFKNLLSAVRSRKFSFMDVKVGDETGGLEELIRTGESISDQISKAFEKEYYAQELAKLREVAQAKEEPMQLLEKGELSKSAENIQAAMELLEEKPSKKTSLEEQKTIRTRSSLWESLEQKESFVLQYKEVTLQAEKDSREAVLQAESYVDLKKLQLTGLKLHVAGAVAESEEYFFPMDLDGETTNVHMTFQAGDEESGRIDFSLRFYEESFAARLEVKENRITGYVSCDRADHFVRISEDKVMNLEKLVDIFNSRIKEESSNPSAEAERIRMEAQLSVVHSQMRVENRGRQVGRTGSLLNGRVQENRQKELEKPNNREMYRIAKRFLEALRETAREVTYEN